MDSGGGFDTNVLVLLVAFFCEDIKYLPVRFSAGVIPVQRLRTTP